VVASIGELGTSRMQIHFSPAATAAFSHVLSSLESTGTQIKDILDKSKKRYVPLVVFLGLSGLAIAGCSSAVMDPNQLRGLQGQISVPGDMISVGAQGGNFQIGYFVNGSQALLDQARNAGVSEADIQLFLAQTQAHVSASVDGVPTGLQCSSGGPLQTNCSLPIRTGRDGVSTIQISAQTCKQPENICGAPAQASFRVNSDTQGPRIELQPQMGPDGKMRILIKAFDQSPVLRSIDAASCDNPSNKIAVGSDGKTTAMFADVVLFPGPNCFQVNAVDAVGNTGSKRIDLPYSFEINLTSAELTQDGKIKVGHTTQNSLFPGLQVNISHCGFSPESAIKQQVQANVQTTSELRPIPGDNTCLRVEAVDPQGVIVGNDYKTDIQYPVITGPIIPVQDVKTGEWFLTGSDVPSYMNPDSAVMNGVQKSWKWKPFEIEGSFSCEKLPNGTLVNDISFPFVAKCTGIDTAGNATVEFQMGDKTNGYVSAVETIVIPLPAQPPLRDAFQFYGTILAAAAAAGTLGRIGQRKIRQVRLEGSVRRACGQGDFVAAGKAISQSKVDDPFKAQMSEYAAGEEIRLLERQIESTFVSPDKKSKTVTPKQLIDSSQDILRLLTHPSYTTETTSNIMTKYIARLRDYLVVGFTDIDSITKFIGVEKTKRETDQEGTREVFNLLTHVINLQCREVNSAIWNNIMENAPDLAKNLRRISILYLLSRGNRLFNGRNFRSLVVGPNEFEFVIEALWDVGRFDDFTKCEELASLFSAGKQVETAIAKVRAKKTRNK